MKQNPDNGRNWSQWNRSQSIDFKFYSPFSGWTTWKWREKYFFCIFCFTISFMKLFFSFISIPHIPYAFFLHFELFNWKQKPFIPASEPAITAPRHKIIEMDDFIKWIDSKIYSKWFKDFTKILNGEKLSNIE